MSATDLWIDISLRLQQLSWLDWLDFLLVLITIFLVLTALERAQATFMIRGLSVIGLVLLIVFLVLPLPAFSLLVRIFLVFMVVALPVVFQRQLRFLFEDVGRSIGLTDRSRRTTEELMQPLVRAVEQMSSDRTGALIVLEGDVGLDEIAETGVMVGGDVSSELLRAIFYSTNPLHDGAVLIRGQRVVAAACVLPVARGLINGDRSLGTRHRAAVGMSRRSDALVIVVSEETGTISAAESGHLEALPDQSALRERLLGFARHRKQIPTRTRSVRFLFDGDSRTLRPSIIRRARRVLIRLAVAALLALSLWWFVITTSSSLPELEIRDVSLQVDRPPAGLVLVDPLPDSVDLVVRTVQEAQPALNEEAFAATVSLQELSAGVQQVPVDVVPRTELPLQIVEIQPDTVEVDLAPLAQRSLPITIALADEELLPAAYELQGEPIVEPREAEVRGPQPLVERVAEIRATLSLSETRGPVETLQPLIALDENGDEVPGVVLRPAEAELQADVGRRADVREVGVAIVTSGEPAPGFWISGLSSQPATVVLSGPPSALAGLDSAVATLPVDVEGAAGPLETSVPLDLPVEVSVETRAGQPLNTVDVEVRVSPRRGNLTLTRPIELPAGAASLGLTVRPQTVEILLGGPLPILREIEEQPSLVRVVLSSVDVASGESVEQIPVVVAPEGVRAQLVTRQVTLSRP